MGYTSLATMFEEHPRPWYQHNTEAVHDNTGDSVLMIFDNNDNPVVSSQWSHYSGRETVEMLWELYCAYVDTLEDYERLKENIRTLL